jgi:hypothetical protein
VSSRNSGPERLRKYARYVVKPLEAKKATPDLQFAFLARCAESL